MTAADHLREYCTLSGPSNFWNFWTFSEKFTNVDFFKSNCGRLREPEIVEVDIARAIRRLIITIVGRASSIAFYFWTAFSSQRSMPHYDFQPSVRETPV